MVNSNPETVSTDYDTSDLLFFEPLTTEDVLNICDRIEPDGVIVQFGGQTPLNLARAEQRRRADHRHERRHDRGRRGPREVQEHSAPAGSEAAGQRHRPQHGAARNQVAQVGFPALVRPSYVLGGRAMEICYDAAQFERLRGRGVPGFVGAAGPDRPLPRRRHGGGRRCHRRRPAGDRRRHHGAHRGGGRTLGRFGLRHPPFALPPAVVEEIRQATCALAQRLKVKGLMNIQYAVKREDGHPNVYVLEVNPRQAARCRSSRRRSACRWPRWRPR